MSDGAFKRPSSSLAAYRPEYGYEVVMHRGVGFTADATPELLQNIEDFPVGEEDVFVVGSPKSGTNMLNIILANLFDHWETTKITPNGVVPELSVPNLLDIGFQGYEMCIAARSPRLMKCHLPFDLMPRAFREGKGKVIYIVRNPKDACDSYYSNLHRYVRAGWTWEDHVEAYIHGHVYFGPWLRNVLSWIDGGEDDRVLHLTYEGMQQDKRGAIERIVRFVGPVKPDAIDRVIGATDFQTMKKSGLDKQFQPSMTRREGKVGGWKQRFTVAQSERFDELLDKPVRARGLHLIYEL